MAYSYAESTAGGSTAIFTVPFEYISKAYVHVSVNGVLVDDALLTWNSSTEIVLPTTPGAGATVRRYRTTPKTPLVTFQSGDLSTDDLNLFAKQCSHLVQEATDTGDSVEAALAAVSVAIASATTATENATVAAAAALAAAAAAALFDPSSYLSKGGNLAGLADKAAARANLALATVAATGAYADLDGKPSLGTASTKDVGTTAGQLVAVQTGGKLPAVDGSQLSGLPVVGVGQTWQDLTASRSIGTVYQNTSGKAILIAVSFGTTSGGTLHVNSGPTVSVVQIGVQSDGGGGTFQLFSFIVPDRHYYSVSVVNGTHTISKWSELR